MGPLNAYLSRDHDRLDKLLEQATADLRAIDNEAYAEFRKGLLRHIGLEQKIVLPVIERLQGGTPAALEERIQLDHGAIVALLVPPPTPSVVATLRSILATHNALEEEEGGLYVLLDLLAGPETDELLARFQSAPEVRVLPHNDRPDLLDATRRAVVRAGYVFKEMG
jgi:hypothetical protein